MRCRATIGIDDDLAPGQPGIAVRPADHELAGRVHVPDGFRGDPARGQDLFDIGGDPRAHIRRGHILVEMLGREHDLARPHRLAILVADRELALGVRPHPALGAVLAHCGEAAQDRVGIVDRRRHKLVGFGHRVAKHDTLIAGALVLVVSGIDAPRDVGRLGVQVAVHLHVGPVKAFLLVADILHAFARDLFDPADDRARTADLAPDHHPVGGGKGLAGHPRLRVFGQKRIEDRIGNPVADLVGVPLGNRFGGERVVLPWHEGCSIV